MIEQRLKEMGIKIEEVPDPLGAYRPCVISAGMIYISGQLPLKSGKLVYSGKVGDDLTIEEGREAARLAAINCISVLKSELDDLRKVARIVKLTGYVASAEGFTEQADVVNGASELFHGIFGEKGVHARAAVGVYELPKGAPVEIEVIAELVT